MFLFKPPSGYGLDAWNGLYFRLTLGKGGKLGGALQEADFNILAVPSDASDLRPISHSDLTPARPGAHRFDRVVIE